MHRLNNGLFNFRLLQKYDDIKTARERQLNRVCFFFNREKLSLSQSEILGFKCQFVGIHSTCESKSRISVHACTKKTATL